MQQPFPTEGLEPQSNFPHTDGDALFLPDQGSFNVTDPVEGNFPLFLPELGAEFYDQFATDLNQYNNEHGANAGINFLHTGDNSLFLPTQELSDVSHPVEGNVLNADSQVDFSHVDDTSLFLPQQESSHVSEDQGPDDLRLHPSTDEEEAESLGTNLPESNIDHSLYDYFGYELPSTEWMWRK